MALGALLAAPFVLLPGSSRANGPRDKDDNQGNDDKDKGYYRARDADGRSEWWQDDPRTCRMSPTQVPPGTPGNSVPLNEGQIFLIIAGLGLGAKMLYDHRKDAGKRVV